MRLGLVIEALANARLATDHAGQVALRFKRPFHDGTTQVVMPPQEFMQPLAALLPRPRQHLIRFHGVLAANAKLRAPPRAPARRPDPFTSSSDPSDPFDPLPAA